MSTQVYRSFFHLCVLVEYPWEGGFFLWKEWRISGCLPPLWNPC